MRKLTIFILYFITAHQAICQELVSVVKNSRSPNGKFDIMVSGKKDWEKSYNGAKALFIVAIDTKKTLSRVDGFENWHGGIYYPILEVQWSPDSSKVAICRTVRKGGGVTVYVFQNGRFVPHVVTVPNIIELIERAARLQHPWEKYYRIDTNYVGIKGWDGNSTLQVSGYGDLLGLHSNNSDFAYDMIMSVEINDDGKMKLGKPSVTLEK